MYGAHIHIVELIRVILKFICKVLPQRMHWVSKLECIQRWCRPKRLHVDTKDLTSRHMQREKGRKEGKGRKKEKKVKEKGEKGEKGRKREKKGEKGERGERGKEGEMKRKRRGRKEGGRGNPRTGLWRSKGFRMEGCALWSMMVASLWLLSLYFGCVRCHSNQMNGRSQLGLSAAWTNLLADHQQARSTKKRIMVAWNEQRCTQIYLGYNEESNPVHPHLPIVGTSCPAITFTIVERAYPARPLRQ